MSQAIENPLSDALAQTMITLKEVEDNVDIAKLLDCYAIKQVKEDSAIRLFWNDVDGRHEGLFDCVHRDFLVGGKPVGLLEFYAILEGLDDPETALQALTTDTRVHRSDGDERKRGEKVERKGKLNPKQKATTLNQRFFKGKTFIPKRLGEELKRRRPFRNITEVRSDGHLYSYANGVFRRNGPAVVEQLTAEILGEAYRDSRRSETEAWLRATAYTQPDLANQHADLVNVANGMLDWRTGELLRHDPKYLSTMQIPVKFDPAAMCPVIDDFFLTTLPADCIDLALEWIGYCLLPTAKYCKAVMCVGPAANGKSTFLGLLGAFVGQENTANIPLRELDEHRFKRAMLQDKLANLFSDLDQRALKHSGYFKLIVSGDPIDAERKHQHPFTFKPFCKLIFSANRMPTSYDKSPAFYRRWLIIPFPNTFEGAAADPDMLDKITTSGELSGLLNKAIDRLRTLEERRGFAEPETVVEAMKTYKLTSDGMVAFLSECCRDAEPEESVGKKALYDAYTSWAEDAKARYTESRAEFNRRLKQFYPMIRDKRIRTKDGKQPRIWENGPVVGEQKEAPDTSQTELAF